MKDIFKDLLDEILQKHDEYMIDPQLLYARLQADCYFVQDEVDLISQSKTTTEKLIKTIHFLKSKPDEAFAVFHKYCHILKWDKVLTFIQKRLEEVDGTNLVLQQPNGNRNLIQSNRQSTSDGKRPNGQFWFYEEISDLCYYYVSDSEMD